MTAANIIIVCLIASQVITLGVCLWLYRVFIKECGDIAMRIEFVLDVLDVLREYVRSQNDELEEQLQQLENMESDQQDDTVDLNDPDWWKRS